MTVSEPPSSQPPGDDTALLTAALDPTWDWHDGRTSRALQMVNYSLLASAILGTAYTSAISTKNYGLAAALAVVETGLVALTSMVWFREANAAASAEPALIELQERMARR